MRWKRILLIAVFVWGVMGAERGSGDQRSYVWTYEYLTLEKGQVEFEYYFTLSTPDLSRMKGLASSEHWFEVEVGMTDRFDFSIYQIFFQEYGGSLKYKGFKLRARYRLGEKGKWFVDPLIYAEYKSVQDLSKHELELKLVLARDIGRFNITLNPTVEVEKESGEEWEVEFEYAGGLKFRLHELFSAGVEFKGSEYGHYVGPVISHGTPKAWVALGSAFKIARVSEGKPEFEIRLLLGISPIF